MRIQLLLLSLTLGTAMACGHNDPGENHGDLFQTAEGLSLTVAEHTPGWGRSDCFSCHLPKNIHVKNQTGYEGIDLDAINDQVQSQGEASCASCHGSNGL